MTNNSRNIPVAFSYGLVGLPSQVLSLIRPTHHLVGNSSKNKTSKHHTSATVLLPGYHYYELYYIFLILLAAYSGSSRKHGSNPFTANPKLSRPTQMHCTA